MTLIDRLSKLDGTSREADADIYEFLGYEVKRAPERVVAQYRTKTTLAWAYKEGRHWLSIPRLTSSIEAAITLSRRFWPDVMYRIGNDGEGPDPSLYLGELFIPGEQKDRYLTGVASNDAIALCIAILRAKEASNGND